MSPLVQSNSLPRCLFPPVVNIPLIRSLSSPSLLLVCCGTVWPLIARLVFHLFLLLCIFSGLFRSLPLYGPYKGSLASGSVGSASDSVGQHRGSVWAASGQRRDNIGQRRGSVVAASGQHLCSEVVQAADLWTPHVVRVAVATVVLLVIRLLIEVAPWSVPAALRPRCRPPRDHRLVYTVRPHQPVMTLRRCHADIRTDCE